jgi:hypothetical protein
MNHVVEVLRVSAEPRNLKKFRKLNKMEYVDLETGEILEYKLNENRGQNVAGLKRTFKEIRNIINNNFTGADNELFVTLTYAENMMDTKKLYKDFELFVRKLKRKYNNVEYMSVIEPQARGAWHCHVLLKFPDADNVYIDNDKDMARMWGHGFTKTRKLKNVDNIGAYISAYLADVEACEENRETIFDAITRSNDILEVVEKNVDGVKKSYVKGARLHMYPSGMNLYRCSRGIKKPETEKMLYKEVKKIVGSGQASYTRTIDIERDGKTINAITYEQYNLKRRNGKTLVNARE